MIEFERRTTPRDAHRRPTFRQSLLPPLVVLVFFVSAWWLLVTLSQVKPYLLPSPWQVGQAAVRIRRELLAAVGLTAASAIAGFCLSVVLGSLTAMLFAQFRNVRMGCFPYAVLLQTVPVVAVAPLVINCFGAGLGSVILISFMISLFPIIANVTAGLTSVDENLAELFRLHGATRWQTATRLQFPHAIPNLITGARTSVGLAVIGAIVGEFFAGNSTTIHGLGFLVPQRINWLKTDEAFAAVATATLLGISMFAMVGVLENTVLSRWKK